MEVVWSPQSLEDLEEIGDFIALNNPERACSFIDEVINSVERLIEFPESGKILEENPVFRCLIFKTYRLIYQINNHKVYIVTVLGPGRRL